MINLSEILVIGVVALIVIGPKRIPETAEFIGKMVGQAMHLFKEIQKSLDPTASNSHAPPPENTQPGNIYEHQKIEKPETRNNEPSNHS